MGCFTANSTVLTSNGQRKRLVDLEVGEQVQSIDAKGNVIFSEVLAFLDRNVNQSREFVRLDTEDGQRLTVTPSHLVMAWLPQRQTVHYMFADQIQEGDYLLASVNSNLEPKKVVKVAAVLSQGVFAPLTTTGTVIVDDVAASCYAVIDSQSVAHWSFMPFRLAKSIWHWVAPASMLGQTTAAHQNGIHWYAKALYSMKDVFLPTQWLHK